MEKIKKDLTGYCISGSELEMLRNLQMRYGFPRELVEIMKNYRLAKTAFEPGKGIAEEPEYGFSWMSPQNMQEETEGCYPGIVAVKLGYFPVGECLFGSGDPYFIFGDDLSNLKLVQISHQMASPNHADTMIWPVSDNLSELLLESEKSDY